ncbi:predicted protein [Uncinocarpus reesii 1704]|uniref:DUF3955 domain-containing protein n=1 Tax=Uncinocarpus reesii (strain UAMH 1704) TaxID=336963 RepID=C4JRH0_UNCRE|nr:uncharacterized protein UREG_05059 [Uncinocarpus reesii 1704]EEP80217.1 predicted protein [Uncinocarpus reesii 1704]
MPSEDGTSSANAHHAEVVSDQDEPQASSQGLIARGTAHQSRGKLSDKNLPLGGVARHTLGVSLLLVVVVLWTLSNFLASTIFADNTYSKPFFITYLSTGVFTLTLIPLTLRHIFQWWKERRSNTTGLLQTEAGRRDGEESHPFLTSGEDVNGNQQDGPGPVAGVLPCYNKETGPGRMDFRATARLSLQFCLLWAYGH